VDIAQLDAMWIVQWWCIIDHWTGCFLNRWNGFHFEGVLPVALPTVVSLPLGSPLAMTSTEAQKGNNEEGGSDEAEDREVKLHTLSIR
jgi:hypothetical protein